MLQPKEAAVQEKPEFKWGAQTGAGRNNKDIKFYESFTYDGVEYSRFDCAYFYQMGHAETSIGKLIKMYETPAGEKRVRVVWFFRPIEIRHHLGDYEPRWNELFLASGDGQGLSNINDVDAIIQKCNVLCTSRDPRNPPPSKNELRMANYVFSHTFDVGRLIISKSFGDVIAGNQVEHFFNKRKDTKLINRPNLNPVANAGDSSGNSFDSESASSKLANNAVKHGKLNTKANPAEKGLQLKEGAGPVTEKKPFVRTDATSRPQISDDVMACGNFPRPVNPNAKARSLDDLSHSGESVALQPPKKRKLPLNETATDESGDLVPQPSEQRIIRTNDSQVKRPDSVHMDKRNWFKKLPFDERLRTAKEQGTLILIENVDPSYTSLDVKDLCWEAFHERVEAKMIQPIIPSSPHYGRALVIFESKRAADSATSMLNERCLMLADGRPVVASREVPMEIGSNRSFYGHFGLDRVRIQTREAVSTSHCAQPNNFEYDMAMEWRALQAKSDLKWKKLHEKQAEEINVLKSQLRMNQKNRN